jgi:hypothetical protein
MAAGRSTSEQIASEEKLTDRNERMHGPIDVLRLAHEASRNTVMVRWQDNTGREFESESEIRGH